MNRTVRILQASCFLLLAGCTFPFLRGNAGPAPLPNTPNFSSLAFDTPTAILSPSPFPTETLTPTITRNRGWIPSATPRPTYSPFAWTCVDDGSPDPCHRVFRDISVLPSGEGWVVGEGGVFLHTSGDGWALETSPVDLTLRRVFTLAADDAWAVADESYPLGPGQSGVQSRLLHWNGSVWTTFFIGRSARVHRRSLFRQRETRMGNSSTDDGSGPVYHFIRWDGTEWSTVQDAPALAALQMISADDGWAVGAAGALMHWDGGNWSAVDSPTGLDLDEVAFTSSDSGWAASEQGVILRYALGQWWTYSSLAPNPRRMTLDPDGDDGWMFGSWTRGDIVLRWDTKDWNPFAGERARWRGALAHDARRGRRLGRRLDSGKIPRGHDLALGRGQLDAPVPKRAVAIQRRVVPFRGRRLGRGRRRAARALGRKRMDAGRQPDLANLERGGDGFRRRRLGGRRRRAGAALERQRLVNGAAVQGPRPRNQ